MVDDLRDRDPEIRRRAAWLLVMLAVVAALFVLIFVVFFNGSGGSGDANNADLGPTTTPTGAPASSSSTSSADSSPSDSTSDSSSDSSTSSGSASPSGSDGSSASGTVAPGGKVSCPSSSTCSLDSDVGNAIDAINAYREQNSKTKVPGIVSDAARKCAESNGSDCSGGWAESQVPIKDGRADGVAAVDKIKDRGKLLQDMSSIEVGWAYDPGSKQLYFAIVRQN